MVGVLFINHGVSPSQVVAPTAADLLESLIILVCLVPVNNRLSFSICSRSVSVYTSSRSLIVFRHTVRMFTRQRVKLVVWVSNRNYCILFVLIGGPFIGVACALSVFEYNHLLCVVPLLIPCHNHGRVPPTFGEKESESIQKQTKCVLIFLKSKF